MLPGEYARSGPEARARARGRARRQPVQVRHGSAAADTHVGLASPDNDNYFHKFTTYEPSPHRIVNPDGSIHKSKVERGLGISARGLAVHHLAA